MILTRRSQRSFADGLIAEEVSDLRDSWMQHADEILRDDALLTIVQEALSRRIRKSKTRGRPGTPAEVVLRMLLLKHIRDWSFEALTREVRANLVYRDTSRGSVAGRFLTIRRWGGWRGSWDQRRSPRCISAW
jgi:IS5 family transposase